MMFRYRHGDRPLDGFTIKRGVGHGGFGEVYYAVSDAGREVALKSILQNHEIELRGVQHCINLKSPHLVSIFDVRTGEDGIPWVIMEYVAGPSLRDLLRQSPEGLGEEKAAYLAGEISKGLAYLHERGIVHRDLKPENIFYEDGYVKIGDYGLSKYISVSRQSGQTISVGTVHYMAPEIGSGIYNRGIDIYALGVLLYELLTGRVPFTGDSFGEILMKHLTATPDLEDIPEPFRGAIARALEKKPEDRYATVEEFAAEIFRSEEVSSRVSLFNPATLSIAAHKAAVAEGPTIHAPQGSPNKPAGAPAPAAPPGPGAPPSPAARPAPVARGPAGPHDDGRERNGAGAREEVLERPPPLPAGTEGAGENRVRTPPSYRATAARDPLDQTQRLARALFIALVASTVLSIFRGNVFGSVVGLLIIMTSGAAATLGTELYLARRFQINPGFSRRLVAAFLAFVPVMAGAAAGARRPGPPGVAGAFALLIAMVLIDWGARIDPHRKERVSLGDAIGAGFLGFLAALILGRMQIFLVGGGLAGMSLVVNAFAPFIPAELRRKTSGEEDEVNVAREGAAGGTGFGRRMGRAFQGAEHGLRNAARAGRNALGSLSRSGRDGGHGPEGAGHGSGELAAPLLGNPPGTAARLFWSFVGALLIAGGLSCFAAILFGEAHGDEALACLGFGVGMLGYAGFALYRGHWTRRPTFWGRTVRPFLLATVATGAAIPASLLLFAPVIMDSRSWWGDDEILGCSVILASFLVLGGFLLAFERLVRGPEYFAPISPRTPRSLRPVQPLVRFVELFLGAAATAVALGLVLAGTLGDFRGDDHLAFLSFAVATACLGGYFLRQGLRRVRGTIWQGTVRPFVLFASMGTLAISTLWLSSEEARLHGGQELGLMIVAIFAAVFGAFAYLVRSPAERADEEASRERERERRSPAAAAKLAGAPHGGLAALAMIFWMLGVSLVLWAGGMESGIARAVFGYGPGAPYESWFALFGFGFALCALGSLSAVASRLRCPRSHLVLGIAGQAALLIALLCFLYISEAVEVSPEFLIFVRAPGDEMFLATAGMFAAAAVGAALVAWPARSPARKELEKAASEVS